MKTAALLLGQLSELHPQEPQVSAGEEEEREEAGLLGGDVCEDGDGGGRGGAEDVGGVAPPGSPTLLQLPGVDE